MGVYLLGFTILSYLLIKHTQILHDPEWLIAANVRGTCAWLVIRKFMVCIKEIRRFLLNLLLLDLISHVTKTLCIQYLGKFRSA